MDVSITFSNCNNIDFFFTHNNIENIIVAESDFYTFTIQKCNIGDLIKIRHTSSKFVNLEDIHINFISFKNVIIKDSNCWQVVDEFDQKIGEQIITIGSPDTCKLILPEDLYRKYIDNLEKSANTHRYLSNFKTFD